MATLSKAILAADTLLKISGTIAPGRYTLEEEVVVVTAVDRSPPPGRPGQGIWATVERHVEGSTPAAHASGTELVSAPEYASADGGTSVHGELTGRDEPEQHDVGAISGLTLAVVLAAGADTGAVGIVSVPAVDVDATATLGAYGTGEGHGNAYQDAQSVDGDADAKASATATGIGNAYALTYAQALGGGNADASIRATAVGATGIADASAEAGSVDGDAIATSSATSVSGDAHAESTATTGEDGSAFAGISATGAGAGTADASASATSDDGAATADSNATNNGVGNASAGNNATTDSGVATAGLTAQTTTGSANAALQAIRGGTSAFLNLGVDETGAVQVLTNIFYSEAAAEPPAAFVTLLYRDTTAVTGGLYAWDGAAYVLVSLAVS